MEKSMIRDGELEGKIGSYIHLHGPATTNELAEHFGITEATLLKSCADLATDGIIHPKERSPTTTLWDFATAEK